MDDVLKWDSRTGEAKGVENEKFCRPSQEIITYAEEHNIQMNLWSRTIQRVLRLRIAQEREGLPAPQPISDDWLPFMLVDPTFKSEEERRKLE